MLWFVVSLLINFPLLCRVSRCVDKNSCTSNWANRWTVRVGGNGLPNIASKVRTSQPWSRVNAFSCLFPCEVQRKTEECSSSSCAQLQVSHTDRQTDRQRQQEIQCEFVSIHMTLANNVNCHDNYLSNPLPYRFMGPYQSIGSNMKSVYVCMTACPQFLQSATTVDFRVIEFQPRCLAGGRR